jgi:hypothetical protein
MGDLIREKIPRGYSHGTEMEKVFLDGLGSFYKGSVLNKDVAETWLQRRRRLLANYQAAMATRKDWGMVDKKEIARYVKRLLKD